MRCPSSFGDPALSWLWFPFLEVFPCPCLCLYLCPWAGCDLALSLTCLTIRECLFATGPQMDCSSCTIVKPTLGFLMAESPTNYNIHQTFAVHHARVEIRVLCAVFLCASCHYPFPKLYGTPLGFPPFAEPLPQGAMKPAWVLVITRKTTRLRPSIFQFPWQPLQPCSDGTDSTSNAVACQLVHFCPCKLPLGYHHLRVHRFVSRTDQHFCSIVED